MDVPRARVYAGHWEIDNIRIDLFGTIAPGQEDAAMDGRSGRGRAQAHRLFGTTRGKVLALLCRGRRTVGELATHLGLTRNAARAQVQRLQRDGLVRPAGSRRGIRRPHVDYDLTDKARELFPGAYEPVLRRLVDAMSQRLSARALRTLISSAARDLVRDRVGEVRGADPRQRVSEAVSRLGGLAAGIELEKEPDKTVVRSCSCPLASVTASHPELCAVFAGVLSEVFDARVREQCKKGVAPQCCFQVAQP